MTNRTTNSATKRNVSYASLCFLFVLVSAALYSGNADHELLNWDDRTYVTNNPWVTNPNIDNVVSSFTEFRAGNWHPLTWLSYIPEYAFCGDRASCYKATNSVLHGINSFLVFLLTLLLVSRLQNRPIASIKSSPQVYAAALVAAVVFLVHPQHVESVIWVAQRKDLLCALFYFLGLIFYIANAGSDSLWRKYLPLLFFILAIMSKSMAISFPMVIVLLDIFLLHKERLIVKRDIAFTLQVLIIEKLPYYLLMVLIMWVTLNSQAVERLEQPSLLGVLAICASALQYYIVSFFLPWGFSPFYPVEIVSFSLLSYLPLAGICIAGIAYVAKNYSAQKLSTVALFILFFGVTLLPVLGVVKVGEQAYADRYSYIPMLGFYVLLGWTVSKIELGKTVKTQLLLAILIPALIFLLIQTRTYKDTWRDDLSFWSAVVDDYPSMAVTPYDNLANSYATIGDYESAIENYRQSIEIDSKQMMSYINLAGVYEFIGDRDNALLTFAAGADNNPQSAGALSSAGRAYLNAGDRQKASDYLQAASILMPDLPDVRLGRGMLSFSDGDLEAAIEHFEAVPRNVPQHLQANLLKAQAWGYIDKQEAMRVLDELRDLYGSIPQLDETRRLIENR